MDAALGAGVRVTAASPASAGARDAGSWASSAPRTWRELRAALRVDMAELAATKGSPYPSRAATLDILTLPGFWSVTLWRVGNLLHHKGLRPLSRMAYVANMVVFGADLASGASVGPGMVMPHPVGVGIASDVVFGERCRVMGLVRIGGGGRAGVVGHPVIGDDVWLLDGAKVFGPVTVGNQVVVGASAIVGQDVPDRMFVAGPGGATSMRPRTDLDGGIPMVLPEGDDEPPSRLRPRDDGAATG